LKAHESLAGERGTTRDAAEQILMKHNGVLPEGLI
jgi:hypothetical protein